MFLYPQARYSEDIDLVQLREEPIKPILQAIRDQLEFLGGQQHRQVKQAEHNWTVFYDFETELPPPPNMKIKIEINTREHFNVLELNKIFLQVDNPWYENDAEITTYQPEELLGTKLRALYQRKKGRDLFDLHYALSQLDPDTDKINHCFREYMMGNENTPPTARQFELNMEEKMQDPEFTGDITALLRSNIGYDHNEAYKHIYESLIQHI